MSNQGSNIRNYSSQVLQQIADAKKWREGSPDWRAWWHLDASIKKAIHFALPDGGQLLDRSQQLQFDSPDELRPPFETIVLEYFIPAGRNTPSDFETVYVSKRMICVFEATLGSGGPEGVMIWPSFYSEAGKVWSPTLYGAFIPYNAGEVGRAPNAEVCGVEVYFAPMLGDTIDQAIAVGMATLGEFAKAAAFDLADEVWAYFDFCKIMACRNVALDTVAAPEKLNRARKKSGKAALFDYKVLVLTNGALQNGCGGGGAADRRSHLRRGHIRRLSDGRRVWVNAAFVRGTLPGFVHKDYRVAG